MARYTNADRVGTLYRAVCHKHFTRDDGTEYTGAEGYGPFSRKQDAKAAVKRNSDAAWYRRSYPDYTEQWRIERLTGDWQEVTDDA